MKTHKVHQMTSQKFSQKLTRTTLPRWHRGATIGQAREIPRSLVLPTVEPAMSDGHSPLWRRCSGVLEAGGSQTVGLKSRLTRFGSRLRVPDQAAFGMWSKYRSEEHTSELQS